ncbi:MAG: hypothetical protein ACYTFT_09845 [Planctomycetota bacterium]
MTFVRHKRSDVRDANEAYLKARGVSRAKGWEGVLVVDREGEAVRMLKTPLSTKRLTLALKKAILSGTEPSSTVFRNAREPFFALDLDPVGLTITDYEPRGAVLAVRARGKDAEVRIRAKRIGPGDDRGAAQVLEWIGRRRAQLPTEALSVKERRVDLPFSQRKAALFTFRPKEPDADEPTVRAELHIAHGGDHYLIEAGSRSLSPAQLGSLVASLLGSLSLGDGGAPEGG